MTLEPTIDFNPRGVSIARRLLHEGVPLPAGLLPPRLSRSWERARSAGLRPQDRALFQHSVGNAERRRVRDAHGVLIDQASPDMQQLRLAMRSPNWVVLLTDAEGTIVHSLGQHEQAPRELRLPLHCGRRLLESELGTQAPGVALHSGRAAVVCGGQHYLDELERFNCVAAPVWQPDGTLAGILDITGFDIPMDPGALDRVWRAATSIENRLFERSADAPGCWLMRLHEDARFLGTPAEALLCVRQDDGRVLAMNATARRLFGSNERVSPARQPLLTELLEPVVLRHLGYTPAARDALPGRLLGGGRIHLWVEAPRPHHAHPGGAARSGPTPASGAEAAPVTPAPQRSGVDPALQQALKRAAQVLPHGIPLLLQGETGVGKEWFAQALHRELRPQGPFIAVDCSALAETLAEAELFGHVEGAYTGSRKGGAPGKLEQAQHGVLLLDEIGDMPLSLQTRLLRVLQERRVSRLGSVRDLALDVLVIAATHRDLAARVAEGRFRHDLFFRLQGLRVQLPPLRERTDLETLIDDSLLQFAAGAPRARLPDALRRCLLRYAWPGNVRQLRQVLQVASALAGPDQWIDAGMLPPEIIGTPLVEGQSDVDLAGAAPNPDDLAAMQREFVRKTLEAHRGNVSAAARQLGISRTTIYKHLRD